ncbi:hypothetical protein [Chryseobacterium sp.]|uniref:hypothetical protein n=1 Tax=Chryseobacterium sp. TaxID=1871047 RepID=UPI00289F4977|nr:hypothetical protein [Chryseobacterium sp.]
MKNKSFNKYLKRHIFDGRITTFSEIIDDSIMHPFHKELKWKDGTVWSPEWQYEYFRHGINDNDYFFCYAKSSNERKTLEEIGIRSDHNISRSKFKKDQVLRVSTDDMYKYPSEVDLKEFFIKIIDAECIIEENTFWWKYKFELVKDDTGTDQN